VVTRLLLGLLIALALPASARADAPYFGFNDNAATYGALTPEQDARILARLGANSSRLTIEWRYVQQAQGAPLGFGLYAPAYEALVARGIRPLITLLGSPRWAWQPWVFCLNGRPCHFPPDRGKDADWRAYVSGVVEAFPDAIGIEVWNEPNLRTFWESGPDPARYTELLRSAREAVKGVDPAMPVIGGALAPDLSNNASARQIGMRPFLDAMYAAGAAGLMDGLAIHPYPFSRPDDQSYQAIGIATEARDAAGDIAPLWLTEVGVSTASGISERRQAVVIGDLLTRLRRRPGVQAVYVHELLDRASEPGFGVLRAPGEERPAFCAVQRAVGARTNCVAPRAVAAQRALWDAQEALMRKLENTLARRRTEGIFGDSIFEPSPW
jgi:hypothetical protein